MKKTDITTRRVKKFYAASVRKEWGRLVQDAYHRLELETTMHFLEKHLPRKGLVLDAGGGPGRYAIELAKKGYEVVLLDLTPANLEFARRRIGRARVQDKVKGVIEGSIADMSRFPDDAFDAVICLGGPLSHVLDRRKRGKAIQELIRVARQKAPIFVSVMGKLSILAVELTMFQHELVMPFFKTMRDTGDYAGHRGFTACHFFLPEEFEKDFRSRGVKILEMAGLEGAGSHHARKVNELARNPRRWRMWKETHLKTCTHPSVVGMSEHILLVGRKASRGGIVD